MVETGQTPRIDVAKTLEHLLPEKLTIRGLEASNKNDYKIARQLDLLTLDAIHPFSHSIKDVDARHDKMSPDDLRKWMTDRPTGMLRVVEATIDYGKGKEKKVPIGFVYLYNDAADDPDFARRAAEVRKRKELPDDVPVWEMNFYFLDDTPDRLVTPSLFDVIEEFKGKIDDPTVAVMFADDEDIVDTTREVIRSKKQISPTEILRKLATDLKGRENVKHAFQDIRILQLSGFDDLGDMQYERRDRLPNWVFAKVLRPNK